MENVTHNPDSDDNAEVVELKLQKSVGENNEDDILTKVYGEKEKDGVIIKKGVIKKYRVDGDLQREYFDTSENLRHFANIRFAQLSLFIAITAGLFSAVFQGDITWLSQIVLSCVGVVATAIFWVLDIRVMEYWKYMRFYAETIEEVIKFNQYRSSKDIVASRWSATSAINVLYGFLIVLWVVIIAIYAGQAINQI